MRGGPLSILIKAVRVLFGDILGVGGLRMLPWLKELSNTMARVDVVYEPIYCVNVNDPLLYTLVHMCSCTYVGSRFWSSQVSQVSSHHRCVSVFMCPCV